MNKAKVFLITIFSTIMSWLGVLAVPVFLLVGCNLIDYITGLFAAKYRNDHISSYKGLRGIIKKVCQWLLIVVGAWVDILIHYTVHTAGVQIAIPYIVATVVAVWLVVNEIISILENMLDIGVEMPPFLVPLVKNIKKKVEEAAEGTENKEKKEE